ncbi:MAG: hypothetical protein UHP28_07405 [Treponema sp.]|nr:hypothetical protein [Treponema sp.]
MMRNQYSHTHDIKKNKRFEYTSWKTRQGREDAQMLLEKDSEHLNQSSLESNEDES